MNKFKFFSLFLLLASPLIFAMDVPSTQIVPATGTLTAVASASAASCLSSSAITPPADFRAPLLATLAQDQQTLFSIVPKDVIELINPRLNEEIRIAIEGSSTLKEALEKIKIAKIYDYGFVGRSLEKRFSSDLNTVDNNGWTPLYRAAWKGQIECVKTLIVAGADLNKAGYYGRTPLYGAAWNGHTECVKALIAAGADLNKANKDGGTPLWCVAFHGHVECVTALVAAKADLNTASNYGKTVFDTAREKGHTAIVSLLEKAQREKSAGAVTTSSVTAAKE